MAHSQQEHGGQIHAGPRKRQRQRMHDAERVTAASKLGISVLTLESQRGLAYAAHMSALASEAAERVRAFERQHHQGYGYY